MNKPRIGIIPGDPSGIGPELIAKLLNTKSITEYADILIIGDKNVLELGKKQANMDFNLTSCNPEIDNWIALEHFAWYPTHSIQQDDIVLANATKASGKSTLEVFDTALDFLNNAIIDAIVFAPFNKEAMHKAGMTEEDELHYMANYLNVDNYICEVNTFDNMWTSRITSHIALKDVAKNITKQGIVQAVELIDTLLKRSGIIHPKIAVAALNPHAGDGGSFGREEIDIIAPTVVELSAKNPYIIGPLPADTVFLKAVAKEVDAVVTMYHDQGQIALKILGFDKGVTVQGGMPYPITTPAHGTAFDIVGQGVADVKATIEAFYLACRMVKFGR